MKQLGMPEPRHSPAGVPQQVYMVTVDDHISEILQLFAFRHFQQPVVYLRPSMGAFQLQEDLEQHPSEAAKTPPTQCLHSSKSNSNSLRRPIIFVV